MKKIKGVEPRGTNSYRLTVSCGYNSYGKKLIKRRTITVPEKFNKMTENKKEEYLIKQFLLFKLEVENGTYLDGEKMTLNEFIDKWLEREKVKKLRPTTLARYDELLRRIRPALGHYKLTKIQTIHLNDFYGSLSKGGTRFDYTYTLNQEYVNQVTKEASKIAKQSGLNIRTIKGTVKGKPVSMKTANSISEYLGVSFQKTFSSLVKGKGLSEKNIIHHHRLISTILSTAKDWNLINSNPAESADVPALEAREANFYSIEETKQLLELLKQEPIKYQTMINIALFCGLRLGELANLEWKDIDFNNLTLNVSKQLQYLPAKGIYEAEYTKTKSGTREMSIPQILADLLNEYKIWQEGERAKYGDLWIETDKIFTKNGGGAIFPGTPSAWFRKFVERHNMPKLTFHQIRHTNASLLIGTGVDIATVSKRLGHADKSVTLKIYTHAIKEMDRHAADSLEETFNKHNLA